MRWEDERWVKLYTKDTPTWKLLPWEGRALLPLLLRKVDRAGLMDLGDADPCEAVAAMVDLPLEVVEVGLAALTKKPRSGEATVEIHGSTLVVPSFQAAQEATSSDAERKRAARERARARVRYEALTGQEVTKRDHESQNVTDRHVESREVTSGHSESRVDKTRQENTYTRARARDAVQAMFAGLGVPMPDPQSLLEAVNRIESYANATGCEVDADLAGKIAAAFKRLLANWSMRSAPTPQLLVKHWDAIQAEIAGTVVAPKAPTAKAPPREEQRRPRPKDYVWDDEPAAAGGKQ